MEGKKSDKSVKAGGPLIRVRRVERVRRVGRVRRVRRARRMRLLKKSQVSVTHVSTVKWRGLPDRQNWPNGQLQTYLNFYTALVLVAQISVTWKLAKHACQMRGYFLWSVRKSWGGNILVENVLDFGPSMRSYFSCHGDSCLVCSQSDAHILWNTLIIDWYLLSEFLPNLQPWIISRFRD